MGKYSQSGRPMRVDGPLPEDTLLLEGFEAEEGLSRPYLYTLDFVSEDRAVDAKDVLRKPFLVSLETLAEQDPFLTHGVVRSFVRLGVSEELASYRAEMVPAFWFLTQTFDCKIFQEMTALEIVKEVLDKADPKVEYEDRCTRTPPKREYCVQYRESSFNFVARLLEEEGIFYFFEHGESAHKLILADAKSAFKPCPGYEKLRVDPEGALEQQWIRSLVEEHAVRSYEVMLSDYDPLQPSLQLFGSGRGQEIVMDPVFDYPGLFTDRDVGEQRARIDLERREKMQHRVSGTSTAHGLRAGTVIEVEDHVRAEANRGYYLDRIRHSAHSGGFRAWDDADFHYSNEFTAFPDDVPFRPDIEARRPIVRGTQTAVVVGKKGEEVWVDQHGRIKVQFHWDRYGKKDENSSCWVRVSTQTAGKNWGHIEIPRIGHEVIVDFLEGNPDRPIVVGSVYNAEMTTPYPLPDKQLVSGIKTKSSPKATGYNEFIMDDLKDEELIRMHAQRNHQVKILRTESRSIGEHQLELITGARGTRIDGKAKLKLEDSDEIGDVDDGGGKWDKDLGDVLVVEENRFVHVKKEQDVTAEKGHHLLVKKGDVTSTIEEGNHEETIEKGDHTTKVTGGDITVSATTGQIAMDAKTKIVLKCGGSSITMEPAKITLKIGGSKVVMDPSSVKIEGGMFEAKGKMTAKVEGGIQGTFKGGVTGQLEGGAMAVVKGGIVKIN
ncbi:MAG: type VI secretion system tip protein VgrG [Gemmatimonadetes bacterium]|nr:type VI secretion system tip protein VgrG [Gemmatimonadota bacterium]NNK62974.1 type VI secretion system tip protein VgrG [Gemmatimonadota bacterium]